MSDQQDYKAAQRETRAALKATTVIWPVRNTAFFGIRALKKINRKKAAAFKEEVWAAARAKAQEVSDEAVS